MATQNPVEQEGTYTLPEAQVDRFMLKVVIDYPKREDEQLIIRQNLASAATKINAVLSTKDLIKAQESVNEVYLDEKIEQYIVDLIFATRFPENYGLSNLKSLISFGPHPEEVSALQRLQNAMPLSKEGDLWFLKMCVR